MHEKIEVKTADRQSIEMFLIRKFRKYRKQPVRLHRFTQDSLVVVAFNGKRSQTERKDHRFRQFEKQRIRQNGSHSADTDGRSIHSYLHHLEITAEADRICSPSGIPASSREKPHRRWQRRRAD